ncbi:uncharacterized protein BJ212DRAFT_1272013, partial [Suillus subaureus]
ARWARQWSTSPCHQCLQHIDPLTIEHSFIKLTSSFLKCLTSLILGLCTHHLPLNQHLF